MNDNGKCALTGPKGFAADSLAATPKAALPGRRSPSAR